MLQARAGYPGNADVVVPQPLAPHLISLTFPTLNSSDSRAMCAYALEGAQPRFAG